MHHPQLPARHQVEMRLLAAAKTDVILRVARPADHLDDVVWFYAPGLGLTVRGSF